MSVKKSLYNHPLLTKLYVCVQELRKDVYRNIINHINNNKYLQ